MISLTFDLNTGLAKLAAPATLKVGADVPVRVVFAPAPGTVGGIQVGIGADGADPATLAYTEAFTAESDDTWLATLDASDTRLVAAMSGKGATAFNLELACTLDGVRQVAPNVSVSVQPAIITTDPTSDAGPSYLTAAQTAALYAVKAWQVKAGTYTAVAGDRLQADTSAGAWMLTLPASPAVGDAVEIEDATASFATHNLTVARNGQKINNATANYTASTANAKLRAVYLGSSYGWSLK